MQWILIYFKESGLWDHGSTYAFGVPFYKNS
jgi:hypothetical protein